MSKMHMGRIENWRKIKLTKAQKDYCSEHYNENPGLGYYIAGICIQHPKFGTTSQFTSSWVVKRRGNKIETRNSKYTLGIPMEGGR